MAKKIKVWFDAEADYLEVRFSDVAGYEKETHHDAVMERVDAKASPFRSGQAHIRSDVQTMSTRLFWRHVGGCSPDRSSGNIHFEIG